MVDQTASSLVTTCRVQDHRSSRRIVSITCFFFPLGSRETNANRNSFTDRSAAFITSAQTYQPWLVNHDGLIARPLSFPLA